MKPLLCEDSYKAWTESSYKNVRHIWQNQPNGILHHADIFGLLQAELFEHFTIKISYAGWQIETDIHTAQTHIINANSAEVPNYYIAERIALPILRLCRGAILLHASAIEYHGNCIAMLAQPGIGKSTFAASCLNQPSCHFITDDILPVIWHDDIPYVLPSSSHIAMRHHLFDTEDYVDNISPLGFKHILHIKPEKIAKKPIPLKKLVFISKSENSSFLSIQPGDSMIERLQSQFCLSNSPSEFRRIQFHLITKLFRQIPAFCYTFQETPCDQAFQMLELSKEQ